MAIADVHMIEGPARLAGSLVVFGAGAEHGRQYAREYTTSVLLYDDCLRGTGTGTGEELFHRGLVLVLDDGNPSLFVEDVDPRRSSRALRVGNAAIGVYVHA
jgi:hypothetical protein